MFELDLQGCAANPDDEDRQKPSELAKSSELPANGFAKYPVFYSTQSLFE